MTTAQFPVGCGPFAPFKPPIKDLLLVRARQLARISRVLEGAVEGSGAALVVRERAASGRTPAVRAALDGVAGVTVGSMEGNPAQTDLPYSGLERLLASLQVPTAPSGELRPLSAETVAWMSYVAVARGLREAFDYLVDTAGAAVIAIEEAQWVDRESLRLVASLAQGISDLPVALLISVREDWPAPDLVGIEEMSLARVAGTDEQAASTPAEDPAVAADDGAVLLLGPGGLTFDITACRSGSETVQRPVTLKEPLDERSTGMSSRASSPYRELVGHRFLEEAGWRAEPALLADELVRPPRPIAGSVEAPGGYTVQLLGGFAVTWGSRDVTPRQAQPAQVVKLVALRNRVSIDELIETLWPDAEPGLGRVRIRNVLSRVREACPGLLEREGETVRLDVATAIDVRDFEQEAGAALSGAAESEQATVAALALALYSGELLPDDRYASWASAERERLASRHRELLEVVMDESERAGDALAAVRLAEEAIVLQPYDESLYTRAARLMARLGWRYKALQMLRRAEAVAAELGVPPSQPVRQLYAELRTN